MIEILTIKLTYNDVLFSAKYGEIKILQYIYHKNKEYSYTEWNGIILSAYETLQNRYIKLKWLIYQKNKYQCPDNIVWYFIGLEDKYIIKTLYDQKRLNSLNHELVQTVITLIFFVFLKI